MNRRELLAYVLGSSVLGGLSCSRNVRPSRGPTIVGIDTTQQFQQFEGFGTALASWVPSLTSYYSTDEFARLYLHDLGATALRVDLWEGSVPLCKKAADLSFRNFVWDGEGKRGKVFISTAESLVKRSLGKLRVIASVWSPPRWMKENGKRGNGGVRDENFALSLPELKGAFGNRFKDDGPQRRHELLHRNRLLPDYYDFMAKSLVEWVRLYKSRGVELYGLSAQNEPRFSHWFESCSYTPAELTHLYRSIIDTFDAEGEKLPQLFAPETVSHDLEGNELYLRALLADSKVRQHLFAFATHGYVDGYKSDHDPRSPEKVKRLLEGSGKRIWFTEGGTGEHKWPEPIHILAPSFMNALLHGEVSLITPWQCVGEPPSLHDLAGVNRLTKKSHITAQFFRHIRPGMRRVHVDQPTNSAASCTAFETSDAKKIAVVLLNRSGMEIPFRFTVDGRSASVSAVYVTNVDMDHQALQAAETLGLPPESLVTALISPHSE